MTVLCEIWAEVEEIVEHGVQNNQIIELWAKK
jgi:hypothetical protein